MNDLIKAIEYINKFKSNEKIDKGIRWENLFYLICNLIDNLGNYKKENIEELLQMLQEYDFEKNRNN